MSAAGDDSPSATVLNLQQAFKLALSVTLLYWLALVMDWDMPMYGALTIVLISLDTTGATLRKGAMRVVGTTAGLALGILGLALFPQDSWLTLIYHASLLVVVGYFMLSSRYGYAWFVAGYLPSLVWASTYGKVAYVFHYALYRYLETTAGVVIFTLVCMVFWPRSAGAELPRQGGELWKGLAELLRMYRRQLADGQPAPDAAPLRVKLAGSLARLRDTLQGAYADTPAIAAHKRTWEALLVDARAVSDALELWRQTIADCHRLGLESRLSRIDSSLEKLGGRLGRIGELWQVRFAGTGDRAAEVDDSALLEPLRLEARRDRDAGLSHLDRAALLSFVQQLESLDVTSRELLRTTRILAGLDTTRGVEPRAVHADPHRPAAWDPARLFQALLPAVCFTIGYFFWIYFNPPTGPSVPNMAAALALALVLTPTSALVLIPVLLVPMWLLVAPFYLFVMPQLGTGLQLLILVFCYVFAVGSLFVGRLSPLKTATLVVFVMLTGISNEQRYSFMAIVDTGLMLSLAAGILAVVQMLMSPLRPEKILLQSVRRFFLGCDRIAHGFDLGSGPADPAGKHELLRRAHATVIQPTLGQVRIAQAGLDYDRYPATTPESVEQLLDGLQDIAYRLQALEIAYGGVARQRAGLPRSFAPVVGELRGFLRTVFQRWAHFEAEDEFDRRRGDLQRLSHDLEQQFDGVQAERAQDGEADRALTDLYALLGSVRGLLDAMASTQPAMNQIGWEQLATARF